MTLPIVVPTTLATDSASSFSDARSSANRVGMAEAIPPRMLTSRKATMISSSVAQKRCWVSR